MKFHVLFASLLIFQALTDAKPLEASRDFEVSNDVDYGREKKAPPNDERGKKEEKQNVERDRRTGEDVAAAAVESSVRSDAKTDDESGAVNNAQTRYNSPVPNFFVPLLQRLQFSPQTFLQDRLNELKDGLAIFGLSAPTNSSATATATSKQFAATNGLLNLIGLNDSGFYTDRLEPAGFLGGNGWFANKGGILGGPGAIYSTGSLLTDYQTAYKK